MALISYEPKKKWTCLATNPFDLKSKKVKLKRELSSLPGAMHEAKARYSHSAAQDL